MKNNDELIKRLARLSDSALHSLVLDSSDIPIINEVLEYKSQHPEIVKEREDREAYNKKCFEKSRLLGLVDRLSMLDDDILKSAITDQSDIPVVQSVLTYKKQMKRK